ncbi:TPA: hypothetical protein JG871_003932 [Enterobacter hormaechei subsp. xiangfangensis]|nr:hypothetical protein [Enterobacter hormaechei subsp. xiangfangensis]
MKKHIVSLAVLAALSSTAVLADVHTDAVNYSNGVVTTAQQRLDAAKNNEEAANRDYDNRMNDYSTATDKNTLNALSQTMSDVGTRRALARSRTVEAEHELAAAKSKADQSMGDALEAANIERTNPQQKALMDAKYSSPKPTVSTTTAPMQTLTPSKPAVTAAEAQANELAAHATRYASATPPKAPQTAPMASLTPAQKTPGAPQQPAAPTPVHQTVAMSSLTIAQKTPAAPSKPAAPAAPTNNSISVAAPSASPTSTKAEVEAQARELAAHNARFASMKAQMTTVSTPAAPVSTQQEVAAQAAELAAHTARYAIKPETIAPAVAVPVAAAPAKPAAKPAAVPTEKPAPGIAGVVNTTKPTNAVINMSVTDVKPSTPVTKPDGTITTAGQIAAVDPTAQISLPIASAFSPAPRKGGHENSSTSRAEHGTGNGGANAQGSRSAGSFSTRGEHIGGGAVGGGFHY